MYRCAPKRSFTEVFTKLCKKNNQRKTMDQFALSGSYFYWQRLNSCAFSNSERWPFTASCFFSRDRSSEMQPYDAGSFPVIAAVKCSHMTQEVFQWSQQWNVAIWRLLFSNDRSSELPPYDACSFPVIEAVKCSHMTSAVSIIHGNRRLRLQTGRINAQIPSKSETQILNGQSRIRTSKLKRSTDFHLTLLFSLS